MTERYYGDTMVSSSAHSRLRGELNAMTNERDRLRATLKDLEQPPSEEELETRRHASERSAHLARQKETRRLLAALSQRRREVRTYRIGRNLIATGLGFFSALMVFGIVAGVIGFVGVACALAIPSVVAAGILTVALQWHVSEQYENQFENLQAAEDAYADHLDTIGS